jgi:hypothetical protein
MGWNLPALRKVQRGEKKRKRFATPLHWLHSTQCILKIAETVEKKKNPPDGHLTTHFTPPKVSTDKSAQIPFHRSVGAGKMSDQWKYT